MAEAVVMMVYEHSIRLTILNYWNIQCDFHTAPRAGRAAAAATAAQALRLAVFFSGNSTSTSMEAGNFHGSSASTDVPMEFGGSTWK